MTAPRPTAEQQAIVEAACSGSTLAINALAGTGKTSTLRMIAEALPRRQIIYLAFNRAIVGDVDRSGGMPPNVTVSTFHSQAFRAMRPDQRRLEARLNGRYVARQFAIQDVCVHERIIGAETIGTMALETLGRFYNGVDQEILPQHVPSIVGTVFEVVPETMADHVAAVDEAVAHATLPLARRIWQEQMSPSSNFPITHDTYVKAWALDQPRIPQDVILFDEAQDASPVFIDIVERQPAQVCWVGDAHQQIYAWRGAVNALDRVRADRRLFLTHSFRFGPDIAATANVILEALQQDAPQRHLLIGAGGKPRGLGRALLARTNATCISQLMHESERRSTLEAVSLVGATEMQRILQDLQSLQQGRPMGQFALFRSYQELEAYAETQTGQDLLTLVRLVRRYGIGAMLDVLRNQQHHEKGEHHRAELTISTCHRAKGREWDQVTIAGDWRDPGKMSDEERRLMYVACTRPRAHLDTSAIQAWLDAMAPPCPHDLPAETQATTLADQNPVLQADPTEPTHAASSHAPQSPSQSHPRGEEGDTTGPVVLHLAGRLVQHRGNGLVWLPAPLVALVDAHATAHGLDRNGAVAALLERALAEQAPTPTPTQTMPREPAPAPSPESATG